MLRFFVEWHKHNTVDAVITGKLQSFFSPLIDEAPPAADAAVIGASANLSTVMLRCRTLPSVISNESSASIKRRLGISRPTCCSPRARICGSPTTIKFADCLIAGSTSNLTSNSGSIPAGSPCIRTSDFYPSERLCLERPSAEVLETA